MGQSDPLLMRMFAISGFSTPPNTPSRNLTEAFPPCRLAPPHYLVSGWKLRGGVAEPARLCFLFVKDGAK